jgi:excisionase family DNA binding protein
VCEKRTARFWSRWRCAKKFEEYVAREESSALIRGMDEQREMTGEGETGGEEASSAMGTGRGGVQTRVVAPTDRRLLSPEELSSYLGVPLATVYRWRSRREGPLGMRVGRHVRYRLRDVERWLDERLEQRP